jgi:predicted nucleic acid-binding protein
MRRAVLWDSSAILALLDASDADHAPAAAIARQLASEGRLCFITNYVEVATHALLLRKLRAIALMWLLTGGLPIVRASPAEEESARALLARFADKDWSLCDGISFALIEARGVGAAFSFDHHFAQRGRFRVLGLG